ncbi:helix-turn-helix domain-containing protein [Qipengyuania sp.]|uniref:helix-turn-helix domain-containing protein n=1 Tax=Qipengyuania sp. TaxID=2004515 RepID=UPI0035C7F09D
MNEGSETETHPDAGRRAGAMLRSAREERGLELEAIAAKTRIPLRHLEAIEAGQFGELPSRTYAIGFSRTYAREVGLDERAVLDQVRADLAEEEPGRPARPDRFEPGDPARVPSRGLAWFSVVAVILLVAGAFTFYRTYFSPGLGPPPLTEETPQAVAANTQPRGPAHAATDAPSGPVVFTSLMDGTWVKFYDGAGERLYEAQMAKGESYTVPSDAQNPQVWTGRPYALAITVGGRQVPKLSEEDTIIKDVSITPEALLSRGTAPITSATPAA